MYGGWCWAEGWPQPLQTSLLHSPQLVGVDVDTCRQTATACDKAEEAAPVLWMEKEISARTSSLTLYPTSEVKPRYYSALYH